jgi:DNA-binding CsgD family transcriptional regulator
VPSPGIRSLEVMGALSRATDLGTGLPDEHALRTAAIAARLAALAGANGEEARRVGLLHAAGCTSDAHDAAVFYGDDIGMRAVLEPAAEEPPLADEDLDAALTAVADFADLKTPFTHGHAPAVSELAEAAGWRCGLPADEVAGLRDAALVHDLGRAGVGNDIWERPGPLGPGDLERVRMYPYWGERALGRSAELAVLGRLAAGHTERLDGSGYYRGLRAPELGTAERLLAAADVFVALGEPRPQRPAYERAAAVDVLREEVTAGRLAGDAAEAVLAAAGERTTGRRGAGLPADLTPREAEVLRLLARGLTNKEIAARLEISPRTAGHHIERAYVKAGVRTRAAATLFAVEHGIAGAHR